LENAWTKSIQAPNQTTQGDGIHPAVSQIPHQQTRAGRPMRPLAATELDRSLLSDLDPTDVSGGKATTHAKQVVSVVMPVRNGERYIEQAVRSILAQTLPTIELIVINDGSTDGTCEILQSCSGLDPRVRVFRNPGAGLVSALNHGLALSRAPIIARMDADDVALPDRLKSQYAEFQRRPQLVILGGQVARIDGAGHQIGLGRYPVGANACRKHLAISSPFAHPAVMFRAEAIRSVGGYREAYRHAEDYDLWLRLSEAGEIDNLRDQVLKYRVHDRNVTLRHAREQAARTALAMVAARARSQDATEPEAPSGAADLADVVEVCKAWPEFQQLAVLAYWRTMSLNGGLTEPASMARFRDALPELSAMAKRSAAGPQFAFMMLRAAAFAARRRARALAAECILRSFAVAPMATMHQAFTRVRAGIGSPQGTP
jgi:hypothetical protein